MIKSLGDSKLFAACEGDFHICHSPHCTLLSPDAEDEPQMPRSPSPWPTSLIQVLLGPPAPLLKSSISSLQRHWSSKNLGMGGGEEDRGRTVTESLKGQGPLGVAQARYSPRDLPLPCME